MALVQKWPFFKLFFLGNISQKSVFYDILEQKKAFLGYKNKKFTNSKNWHFSKGVNPWLWSKNGHFSNFFFRQYKPKKCLLRYSRTNTAFLGYKNKKLKKFKKLTFFKRGEPMVLVQKWPFFQHIFFRQYRAVKCLLRYSRTKKTSF